MGKRGPKPREGLEEGTISAKGYHQIWRDGAYAMAHCWIWEQANGPVPPGHDVHHVNGDKLDNRLDNLLLLTKEEHGRIHMGCAIVDGQWVKTCLRCGAVKPLTQEHWHIGPTGRQRYGRCRTCRKKYQRIGRMRKALRGSRLRR